MAVEVKLPEMGEGIDAGTVVRVLVKAGDSIQENTPLMELETDKALVEVPSDAAGTISKIHVKEGEKVAVGSTLVSLDGAGGGKAESKEAEPKSEPQSKQQATEQPAPDPKETTGATEEQAAAAGGQPELDNIEQGKPGSNGKAPSPAEQETQASTAKQSAEPSPSANGEIIPAGPATRRIARELGIELSSLRGSGQNGRITPEDVYAAARGRMGAGGGGVAHTELPDFTRWGEVRREPLTQVRRLTAEHMAKSWNTVPHVTQFERADITDLEELRSRHEEAAEKAGGKMTITVLLLKAVISALKALPQFNASIDLASGEMIYKQYYHIGIAVDTERGLLVPVLRDVDRKDVIELSRELVELADRARSGKIDIEELRGSTFTISNQGSIGGAEFTPIVNWPDAAILGVGRTRKEPAVVGDTIKPRLMCPLALSYDHRIIDGASAARFIRRLKESLEAPEKLLMGM